MSSHLHNQLRAAVARKDAEVLNGADLGSDRPSEQADIVDAHLSCKPLRQLTASDLSDEQLTAELAKRAPKKAAKKRAR